MTTLKILAMAVAAILVTSLSVQAQGTRDASQGARAEAGGKHELTAETFLRKAAMSGLAEVELGRLAAEKSASGAVREFGEQMVADHSKANEQLKVFATRHGVQLPTALDEEHASTRDRLAGLNGNSFDRSYADVMVHNHGKSIALFERAADLPQDDIARFATDTLTTLRLHLTHAERLQASE